MAKKRMIFEEFFVFSAGLSLMRADPEEKARRNPIRISDMAPFL